MRGLFWTVQARADLAAISAFISQDSPHYASVIIARLIAATDRLVPFPESGRTVPEFENPLIGKSSSSRTASSIDSSESTRFMSSRCITLHSVFRENSERQPNNRMEPTCHPIGR